MRPDYVCGGSSWAAFKLAIRAVLRHGLAPSEQPYPFFHEHSWPHVMVSDKFAIGTSGAMDYYLSAWTRLRQLFARPRLSDAQGKRNHLVGERLMKVHMASASFDHMQTFCCQSPRKHRKQGRCRKDYAEGGVMHAYFHGSARNGTTAAAAAALAEDDAAAVEPFDDEPPARLR
jgi:hypothetical protein